jgi:FkbM family methyltransferase
MNSTMRLVRLTWHLWFVAFRRLLKKQAYLPSECLEYVSPEYLNDFSRFTLAGYNPATVCPLIVPSDESIIVLGGYRGDSVSFYVESYPDSIIHVFEPVPDYMQILRVRFLGNNILLHQKAASSSIIPIEIGLSEDSSGAYSESQERLTAESRVFSEFLDCLDSKVGLAEINIEGGEYDLLLHFLVQSSNLPRVLLVQFHKTVENPDDKRALCRRALQEAGYKQVFNFDWVWERWDLENDVGSPEVSS